MSSEMGGCCPPKFNREFATSVEGIMKMLLILVGAFCWGLVYIGQVMATSNEAPEINDQVLFCTALTLPSWLLTVITFILYSFARADVIPFRFDAALNLAFGILYAACVAYCASYEWFIWWCETTLDVVDTGECPDRMLRNDGQNLAVVILGAVLAAGYCATGVTTAICVKKRKENPYHGPAKPHSSPTEERDL